MMYFSECRNERETRAVWPLRVLIGVIALGIGAGTAADVVGPQSRVALVIGNSAYRQAEELPNPRNDADAIAEVLTRTGFEVDLKTDLDQLGMQHALRDFGLQGRSRRRRAGVLRRPRRPGRRRELPAADRRHARARARPAVRGAAAQPGDGRGRAGAEARPRDPRRLPRQPARRAAAAHARADPLAPGRRRPRAHGEPAERHDDRLRHPAGRGRGRRQRRSTAPMPPPCSSTSRSPASSSTSCSARCATRCWSTPPTGRSRAPTTRSARSRSTSSSPSPTSGRSCRGWRRSRCSTTPAPTPLGIGRPMDPDDDPLTVEVSGLPINGTVKIGDQEVCDRRRADRRPADHRDLQPGRRAAPAMPARSRSCSGTIAAAPRSAGCRSRSSAPTSRRWSRPRAC